MTGTTTKRDYLGTLRVNVLVLGAEIEELMEKPTLAGQDNLISNREIIRMEETILKYGRKIKFWNVSTD